MERHVGTNYRSTTSSSGKSKGKDLHFSQFMTYLVKIFCASFETLADLLKFVVPSVS